jgi:4-amino-4-deoxy-L-arabinose transferase-like glycosyltransferase
MKARLLSLSSANRILIAILVLAVLLRVGAAFYMGNQVVNLPGTFDQISYNNLAQRVLGGHGFTFGELWWPLTAPGEPTAHWSFLYTLYLVFVYAIFGPNPLAARLIQAVIVGILHPLLAYWIGKRVFGQTGGLIAAAITAIYIYFVYYAGALMTEPFYITAILGVLYISLLLVSGEAPVKSQHRWKLAIILGLLLGVTLLLRQLFILMVPFLFAWIWWASRSKKLSHPARPLWVAGIVMALMILPVTLYNFARFDRFVLLNTNAGYAFFWGNHPIYGTRFLPILPEEMGSYQDLIPEDVRHLDEAAMDQALLKKSLQIILDDPGRYILLSISRIPPYFMFWPSRDSGIISNISRVGSFGLFLPFMLYGLVLGLGKLPRGWRESLADPRILLFGFALVYTFIHLMTWTLIRYRLPVDAVLVIFAGVAIEDLARRFGLWRSDVPKFELNQQP